MKKLFLFMLFALSVCFVGCGGKTVAALVVMIALTLMTWIYDWKAKDKRLLIMYFAMGCLLFGMYQIVQVIELPSSLLPRTNIFDWSYYKMEWKEIMGALQNIGNK